MGDRSNIDRFIRYIEKNLEYKERNPLSEGEAGNSYFFATADDDAALLRRLHTTGRLTVEE